MHFLSQRKISAFSLWFEEVKPELQEEQPDLSLEDVSQLATERFRNLPKEEREVTTCLNVFLKS